MEQLNRCARDALLLAGVTLGLTFSLVGLADEPDAEQGVVTVLSSVPEGYADADADACLDCHDEDSEFPVLAILATQHGVEADGRTPLGSALGCQACHGASQEHMESDSDEPPPVEIAFGLDSPMAPQTGACLSCHQGGKQMNWAGSAHDLVNVPCAGCHQIHSHEDPVMVKNINPMIFRREGQASVCFSCHKEQRAQMQHRVSSHPLREGKIECSDCHNPHGSISQSGLTRPTLNETCYQCHAEKRGPFLWEHAPVREDCSLCHLAHGSNNPVLLTTRMPQLCQQCHMASRHPSTPYGGPDGSPLMIDRRVGENSCLNCHSVVHGSNHPSGVRGVR